MSISKTEAKQLLERMIFEETHPQDWVQDTWGLSPLLGCLLYTSPSPRD